MVYSSQVTNGIMEAQLDYDLCIVRNRPCMCVCLKPRLLFKYENTTCISL